MTIMVMVRWRTDCNTPRGWLGRLISRAFITEIMMPLMMKRVDEQKCGRAEVCVCTRARESACVSRYR